MTFFEFSGRGFRLNSEGKTPLNYDVMRQNVLEEIQQPQKQPRQAQVVKTHQIVRDAKTYPSLRRSSLMPNHYLARLISTPPDRLKQEERNLLHIWKNAIYEDVICTTQKTYDWLLMFKDKQDMPNLLRALRRRDLPTIAQAVQSSPRFYTLCENCGLFDVEPLLWDMVRPERQEAQAGRL